VIQLNSKSFNSDQEFVDYYDKRFETRYMDAWDGHIESKIQRFFAGFEAPKGRWLDFGCGQGCLTSVLTGMHPSGNVDGCDISPIAIQKAKERLPQVSFSVWQPDNTAKSYDLVFSHHVLEHVLTLTETLDQIDRITNPEGVHCHILPCGNTGSLEWKVTNAMRDGFEPHGRFFFEEDGHLRRLTSAELTAQYEERGYRLEYSQFTNQYYGALKWIIDLGPDFIREFAQPNRANSTLNRLWIRKLRTDLLTLWRLRSLATSKHPPQHKVKRLVAALALPFAKMYNARFTKKLESEATNRLKDACGSEMLLCFRKGPSV